jgi:hypothetical protein
MRHHATDHHIGWPFASSQQMGPHPEQAVPRKPIEVVLLKSVFLDPANATVMSAPVKMSESTVELSALVVYALGEALDTTLTVWLEGSYDGRTWLSTGLPSVGAELMAGVAIGPEVLNSASSTVAYSFLRARAAFVDTKGGAYLSAVKVVFSEQ